MNFPPINGVPSGPSMMISHCDISFSFGLISTPAIGAFVRSPNSYIPPQSDKYLFAAFMRLPSNTYLVDSSSLSLHVCVLSNLVMFSKSFLSSAIIKLLISNFL